MKYMLLVGLFAISSMNACNVTSPVSVLEDSSSDGQPRARTFVLEGPTYYNDQDPNFDDHLYQKSKDEAGDIARENASTNCNGKFKEVGLKCQKNFHRNGVFADCVFKFYCESDLPASPPANGPQTLSEACAFGTMSQIHSFYCQKHGVVGGMNCALAIKKVSLDCVHAGDDLTSCLKIPFCVN